MIKIFYGEFVNKLKGRIDSWIESVIDTQTNLFGCFIGNKLSFSPH